MEFSKESISILEYLLPGFLSAWIFHGLTAHAKPSQFERVVQALIFNIIIQGVIAGINLAFACVASEGHTCAVNSWWLELPEILKTTVCAIIIGLVFTILANHDHFHRLCRWLRITNETSYPSEWYRAFCSNVTWIVLHFKDGRRLYGWPLEWPSEPNSGHFSITDASWLPKKGHPIELPKDEMLLIDAQSIELVEFMIVERKKKNGQATQSPTP